MGLFGRKTDGKDWRGKYLDLLDEHESSDKSYQKNQVLFTKAIIRLSLASQGYNLQLDTHLDHIRSQLKNSLSNTELVQELTRFTDALIKLDDHSSSHDSTDAAVLFTFLKQQYSTEQEALDQIQSQYINGAFADHAALFKKLLTTISPSSSALTPDDKSTASPETATIDRQFISQQLLQLLNEVDIPAEYAEQTEILKNHLQAVSKTHTFKTALDKTTQLLINIEKHQKSEHKDIASFLSKITQQLTDLEQQARGIDTSNQNSVNKRALLDQSVNQQMRDLQTRSSDATSLEPLKELISTHLDKISSKIKGHKTEEEELRQGSMNLFSQLYNKISLLESETTVLKTKLTVAHNKSLQDPLTGIANRLAYDERLTTEMARFQRYNTPLSLIIWDIDHFKNVNDNYGHTAGDKTLVLIARLLTEHFRETDFVSRFGGEEFAMLLPNTTSKDALNLANKIRLLVEKAGFNFAGNAISITISCGISQFTPGEKHEDVFNRADQALYKAKNSGRNQCVVG